MESKEIKSAELRKLMVEIAKMGPKDQQLVLNIIKAILEKDQLKLKKELDQSKGLLNVDEKEFLLSMNETYIQEIKARHSREKKV
jgi:hypothetical protein